MIVVREELYDPKNKSVIMLSPGLKMALGAQDLHVAKVRSQVLQQLIKVRRQDWRENFNIYISKNEGVITPSTRLAREKEFFSRNIIRTINITSSLFVNKEAKFIIKPKLLQVLKTECQDEDKTRTVFKYKEIIALFSKYILET